MAGSAMRPRSAPLLVALLACVAIPILAGAPAAPSAVPHPIDSALAERSSPLRSLPSFWASLLSPLSTAFHFHSTPAPTPASSISFPSSVHSLPTLSAFTPAVSGVSAYASAAAPSYLPAARLRCALSVVAGSSHRAVSLQLGSPPQTLRLLLDTGSSDLLALNASYCAHSPSSSRSCFNPSAASSAVSPTVVSAAPFVLPTYVDDGEVLSDSSAHAALALANLPVQLVGSNLSLLLGATDLTLQDALLGYPTAASRQVSFVLSSPQAVFVPPIPAVDFPYAVSAVNSLSDVDGLLGLSYAPLSALAQLNAAYSSAFLAITQATQTQSESATFALDFADNAAYIGGIDERYRSSLQWSYAAGVALDEYHSFSLWDLSVCGTNLQQGVLQGSAPLSAIVDTGSSCLSLPAELFDALVSWLPVTCSDATDGSQQGQSTATAVDPSLLGGNAGEPVSSGSPSGTYTADPGSASNIDPHVRYCWLAADLLSGVLPTVSFRMAQSNPALADDDPLQPAKLLISLADLIVGTPRTSATSAVQPQRLCLYRTGSLFTASASVPVLSLGSRTLSSLHAVFAMDSHQLAFANSLSARMLASNATCVSAVRCVGQQSLDATYNVCVDPSCSDYYFFSLDAAAHRCELAASFHVLAALLIAALVLSELGLNEWLIRISARVQGIHADDKLTHSAQQARRRRRANAAR